MKIKMKLKLKYKAFFYIQDVYFVSQPVKSAKMHEIKFSPARKVSPVSAIIAA